MGIFNLLSKVAGKSAKYGAKAGIIGGKAAWGTSKVLWKDRPSKTGLKILGGITGGVFAVGGAVNLLQSASGHGFDPEKVHWGNKVGTRNSYQSNSMEFGAYKRKNLDMNATGSLLFALHNMR